MKVSDERSPSVETDKAASVPKLDRAWVPTAASKKLSGRRGQSTKPELQLRHALHAMGARYRLHRLVAPRLSADIVFPRQRVAVFVDGCFWHSCPRHGKSTFRGPNASRWLAKLARNKERDAQATRLAQSEGWQVIRLWECDIISDPISIAQQVWDMVRNQGPHLQSSRQ